MPFSKTSGRVFTLIITASKLSVYAEAIANFCEFIGFDASFLVGTENLAGAKVAKPICQ